MRKLGTKICVLAAALFVLCSAIASETMATTIDDQLCAAAADIALEAGDYPMAIELHSRYLRSNHNNALAHYHLGFAYGMEGRVTEEIDEYHEAISLGLNKWDLFLNLGLAYYDRNEVEHAIAAFTTAVALGPQHAETHFNLAVVYERENRLDEALHEIIASLVLAPNDPDAVNTDAIICAKMGNLVFARNIWTQLVQAAPDYAPARANLALLNQSCGGSCGSYAYSHSRQLLLSQFGGDD
jgi:Flp pilus assembly protein TadD